MPYSILVADRDPANLELYKTRLTQCGYYVRVSRSVRETLKELAAEIPHLLLTDVDFPDRPGSELILEVRRQESLKHLPVIVVTGKDTSSDRIYLLQMGADLFISKTQPMEECVALLGAVFRRMELDKKMVRFNSTLVDKRAQRLYVDGTPVLSLTKTEFQIIAGMAEKSPYPVRESELRAFLSANSDRPAALEEALKSLKSKIPRGLSDGIKYDPAAGYRFIPS